MALDAAYFDELTARTQSVIDEGVLTYASVGLPALLGTLPADWLRDLDAMDATQKTTYLAQLALAPGGALWAIKMVTYLTTGVNL